MMGVLPGRGENMQMFVSSQEWIRNECGVSEIRVEATGKDACGVILSVIATPDNLGPLPWSHVAHQFTYSTWREQAEKPTQIDSWFSGFCFLFYL